MGVRGLTSYIARNADRYLRPYELHDCDLVIDGDNLACNLYRDVSGCNSAFGGDYDVFYRTVIEFFQLLAECHIRAFVLMDGGYEPKKMKTIEQRVRAKIGMVKHLNPLQSKPMFPLMMREVFIDAARDCGANVMRCIFEADDELAVLSKKLNCPVLSYDSDFYIHNVKYIPLVTLTLNVLTKSTHEQRTCRKLRRCEAKNIAKREHLQAPKESGEKVKKSKQKPVKYLDCCIYTIESLAGSSLSTDMLPIFAALMGNDYIERSQFRKFFTQLGFRGQNRKVCIQQKRINAILKWLRHETRDSAIQKILGWMPKERRSRLKDQLESATSGYSCEASDAFEFFGLTEEDRQCDDSESETASSDDDEYKSSSEEAESNDNVEEEATDVESSEIEEISQSDEEADVNLNEDEEGDAHEKTLQVQPVPEISEHGKFPEWLKYRILSTELPRYFTDLVHLRLYINNPQVENFLFEDCNEIALKILQYIFTIVNQPTPPELRYLTRVVRLTNVQYKTLQPLEIQLAYDPNAVDLEGFKAIFRDLRDFDQLFETITEIPSHFQLYFLAISYWSHQTKCSTHVHLHALIVCLIVLSIVDAKVEPIRDLKRFQKRFVKIFKKARNLKAKSATAAEQAEPIVASSNEQQRTLEEKIKFISKAECVLVMEGLVKYFHLDESLRKRHSDFSSTVLHGFSEFQAVFYHLSALNALFNHPFQAIRISQCYNGMFLYNIFMNLRTRIDIDYYVLNFLLQESKTMSEMYQFLTNWSRDAFTKLGANETTCKTVVIKRSTKKKKIPLNEIVDRVTVGGDMIDGISNDSEFDDVNNKFAMLLKSR